MGEKLINPLFNVHEKYKEVILINPYRFSTASKLLDIYTGAAAAFSLRKLRTAYNGYCIEVRRSSDNTTQNIGFVNDVLDADSLLSFCGTGNGFVKTWYDQSENIKNAIQLTELNQPKIVVSGSIITEGGKYALSPNSATNTRLVASGIIFNNYSVFIAVNSYASTALHIASVFDVNGFVIKEHEFYHTTSGYIRYTLTGNRILSTFHSNTEFSGYENGALVGSAVADNSGNTSAVLSLMNYSGGGYGMNGKLTEAIFYPTNIISSKSQIETDMKTYYGITF